MPPSESMARPIPTDVNVPQSTLRQSRYLDVLAHNLIVNTDRTPSLTRKGVRTYRCGSTFRKTRRLATCRTRAGKVSRDRTSVASNRPARKVLAHLCGRDGRGR